MNIEVFGIDVLHIQNVCKIMVKNMMLHNHINGGANAKALKLFHAQFYKSIFVIMISPYIRQWSKWFKFMMGNYYLYIYMIKKKPLLVFWPWQGTNIFSLNSSYSVCCVVSHEEWPRNPRKLFFIYANSNIMITILPLFLLKKYSNSFI